MAPEKVKELILDLGYSRCRYVGKWNGYNVWGPDPADETEIRYIGLPVFVLENGEDVHYTTPQEGMEILRYFASIEEEEQ